MRLYVAGPMTGKPRLNFAAFEAATDALRAAGYKVISPHEIDLEAGVDPDQDPALFTRADWHAAMRRDIAVLLQVDGIALLPDWEHSEGANVEVTVGNALGIAVKRLPEFLAQPVSN